MADTPEEPVEEGRSTPPQVPNDDRARLMFYLHCLSQVLDFPEGGELTRLSRYRDYVGVTGRKAEQLGKVCRQLSPACLFGKCIVLTEDLERYESTGFAIVRVSYRDIPDRCKFVSYTDNVRLRVKGYMTVHPIWLLENYERPMKVWEQKSKSCTIS